MNSCKAFQTVNGTELVLISMCSVKNPNMKTQSFCFLSEKINPRAQG